jgi:hypothetical protein
MTHLYTVLPTSLRLQYVSARSRCTMSIILYLNCFVPRLLLERRYVQVCIEQFCSLSFLRVDFSLVPLSADCKCMFRLRNLILIVSDMLSLRNFLHQFDVSAN